MRWATSAFGFLYPAYLRGEAYLMAGQGQQAAVEFQNFLDHPGVDAEFHYRGAGAFAIGASSGDDRR